MFVIVQCLGNLTKEQESSQSTPEKIALAMKHAGVAITVTSLTDTLAFGVGATTVRVHSYTGLFR
jgi:Niemann-Pick C1 protein